MVSVAPETDALGYAAARRQAVSGNVLAVGSMLHWAVGFPAAERLLADWHPITLMMLRLLLAFGVLLSLWLAMDGLRAAQAAAWRRGLWIGALGFGMGTKLLLFAQWFTDPVTVALIATTTPVSVATIEALAR